MLCAAFSNLRQIYSRKQNASADNSLVGPLRVIDVEKTIGKHRSGGLYFARSPTWHVISHTWSADIRAFSCAIGERLNVDLEKRQSYEVLFESAGLQKHAAYQALVELLVILQTEGVRWVWFDAVCINQKDEAEKAYEIQHMGTYYQNGVGCYVVQHGIGKGFKLLLEFEDGVKDGSAAQMPHLPRWFTRAWTLQEWVLPPKANGQDKEKNSLCSAMTRMAQNEVCCFKSSSDPHFRKVPGKWQWCFSDDVGYSFLLRLKFILDQIPYDICVEDLKDMRVGDADLELARQLRVKQAILPKKLGKEVTNYSQVVREISVRDASNPEDRVLSVLKLLGVENAVQVRTGQSLQGQLCQFAKSLVDPENLEQAQKLLVHICMVDAFGSQTPGMSWMPEFDIQKGSWQEGARAVAPILFGMDTDVFLHEVEIALRRVAVSDTGVLHVEADVCKGKLVLVPSHPFQQCKTGWRRADELSRPMVLEVEGQVISYVYADMYPKSAQSTTCVLTSASMVPEDYLPKSHGKVCIAFQSPGLQYLRDCITVFLVNIAAVGGRVLGLVCVQEGQEGFFHKIGYLLTARNHFPSSQIMLCCIGGLGHDLNKVLFNIG